jgi:hypothetical protein
MKKGIIMEINDTCLTLLTPDGQFLQARKPEHPYTLGEEVLFKPISQKRLAHHFFGYKQLSIAAAAMFVIIGSLIPVYENDKAYAYMSIDVNPSIELGINKNMQVVKLKAFNSDGQKIISHIGEWEKKSVTEFTQDVLKEMKNEGYLNDHHSMVISTVRTENPEEQTDKQLTEKIDQIKEIAKENSLKVTALNGTEKEMEKAHQLGLTTGKYKEAQIQSVKKKQKQPPQSKASGNSEKAVQNGSPNQAVNQAVNQDETNGVNPPISNQNSRSIDQNKANENKIPPGQLKKTEEAPISNQPVIEPASNNKKNPPINKGQEKKQLQENQNKKD